MNIIFDFKYNNQIIPIECEYELLDRNSNRFDFEYGILNGKSEDNIIRSIFQNLAEKEISSKVEKLIDSLKDECHKQIENDITSNVALCADYLYEEFKEGCIIHGHI
jgi:hypothetical protein